MPAGPPLGRGLSGDVEFVGDGGGRAALGEQFGRAFADRLRALRRSYRKPVVLAETNTEFRGRVAWLRDLRTMLRGMPWVKAIMWSQLPSRGKVQQRGTGVVDWDVRQDAAAAAELRRIIEDGLH